MISGRGWVQVHCLPAEKERWKRESATSSMTRNTCQWESLEGLGNRFKGEHYWEVTANLGVAETISMNCSTTWKAREQDCPDSRWDEDDANNTMTLINSWVTAMKSDLLIGNHIYFKPQLRDFSIIPVFPIFCQQNNPIGTIRSKQARKIFWGGLRIKQTTDCFQDLSRKGHFLWGMNQDVESGWVI